MGSNILFFNRIPFVVIEVRKIKSTPIKHVLHHTEKSFLTYMVKIYKQRGINIITILMNWELEFIRGNIPNLNLKYIYFQWTHTRHKAADMNYQMVDLLHLKNYSFFKDTQADYQKFSKVHIHMDKRVPTKYQCLQYMHSKSNN